MRRPVVISLAVVLSIVWCVRVGVAAVQEPVSPASRPPSSTASGSVGGPGAPARAAPATIYNLSFNPRTGAVLRYNVVDSQSTERRIGGESTKRTVVNDMMIRLKARKLDPEMTQVELSFENLRTTLVRDGKTFEYSSENPSACPSPAVVQAATAIMKRIFKFRISERRTIEGPDGAEDLLSDDLAAQCFSPIASASSLRDLAGTFFTPGERVKEGHRGGLHALLHGDHAMGL